MSECIKCGVLIQTKAATGRPSSYCSPSCRKSAEYEIGRINRRLADFENDLIREKMHQPKDRGVNIYGEKCHERIEALETAIVESEARLKCLLAAKND